MTTVSPPAVRVSRTIRAHPEELFRAWTDPEQLKHWWHLDGKGWTFVEATVDLRVGGRYRLGMTGPDGKTHVAVGEYREIARPTRLVFTWEWENPPDRVGETVVTLEFRDVGKNATELVLTHERFSSAERASSHEGGWTQLLGMLDRFISEKRA